MARIVVGVDGSPSSYGAVRFAIEEARLRDAVVDAVIAYEYPPVTFGLPEAMVIPVPERTGLEQAARQTLDGVLRGVDPGVHVERIVVAGSPRRVLREAAIGADLLVVGSRGYGAVRGLVLGSVSQYLVGHAPCPVVVVDQTPVARSGGAAAAAGTKPMV